MPDVVNDESRTGPYSTRALERELPRMLQLLPVTQHELFGEIFIFMTLVVDRITYPDFPTSTCTVQYKVRVSVNTYPCL